MNLKKTATKEAWETYPVEHPKRIAIELVFTDSQFEKLKYGLIPRQMEDKWFCYFEADWLYFHRSWTGFGIYKAQLLKEPEGYSIREFWVERNPEKYGCTDDLRDIDTFSFLIAQGLLGIDVRGIYLDKNIKTEADTVTAWSNFGRLLFADNEADDTN
jgi:hypothetical protein